MVKGATVVDLPFVISLNYASLTLVDLKMGADSSESVNVLRETREGQEVSALTIAKITITDSRIGIVRSITV